MSSHTSLISVFVTDTCGTNRAIFCHNVIVITTNISNFLERDVTSHGGRMLFAPMTVAMPSHMPRPIEPNDASPDRTQSASVEVRPTAEDVQDARPQHNAGSLADVGKATSISPDAAAVNPPSLVKEVVVAVGAPPVVAFPEIFKLDEVLKAVDPEVMDMAECYGGPYPTRIPSTTSTPTSTSVTSTPSSIPSTRAQALKAVHVGRSAASMGMTAQQPTLDLAPGHVPTRDGLLRRDVLKTFLQDYEMALGGMCETKKYAIAEAGAIWSRCQHQLKVVIDDLVQVMGLYVVTGNASSTSGSQLSRPYSHLSQSLKLMNKDGGKGGAEEEEEGVEDYFPIDQFKLSSSKQWAALSFVQNIHHSHSSRDSPRSGVVIAVDVESASLKDHPAPTLHTLVLLCSSLQRLGVDFSILFFGSIVRVIKLLHTEWDPVFAWMMLTNAHWGGARARAGGGEDFGARSRRRLVDAEGGSEVDAIHCACDLLAMGTGIGSRLGSKKIFVLTDPFAARGGGALRDAFDEAGKNNVDVIGIGMSAGSRGDDRERHSSLFPMWVDCAEPKHLADGFHALFNVSSSVDPVEPK